MPTRPSFFTPARTKQAFQLFGVVLLLAVLTSLLHFSQQRHKYVNTQGMIVYSSDSGSPGHHHIFLVKNDGTDVKQLTFGNQNDTQPCFSPDGSSIAYISDKTGSNQVYVMDAKAEQINQISTGSDSKINPAFSPDGTSVGYLSRGQVLVTDTVSLATQLVYPIGNDPNDTSGQSTNAAQSQAPVTAFAWSSAKSTSGNNLAVIQEDEDTGLNMVTVVPADPTKKPSVMAAAEKMTLCWSPDGSRLAVAALGIAQMDPVKHKLLPQQMSGVILFDTDGNAVPQPLLAAARTDGAGAQDPSIMPDNSKIGFDILGQTKVGSLVQGGIGLSAMQPGAPPQVVAPPGSHSIAFSPDGTHALFLAAPNGSNTSDLVVVDLAAGSGNDLTKGSGEVLSAQWSPAVPKK